MHRGLWILLCFCVFLFAIGGSIGLIVLLSDSSDDDDDDVSSIQRPPAPTPNSGADSDDDDTGARNGLPPVIIIGAGFAGIEAARQLHAEKVDFLILEASARLGGRVQEKKFGGYTLENGANWIQGLEGNPIWDLKQEYGLAGLRNNFDDVAVYDENGTLVENPYGTDDGAQADEAYVGAGTYSRRCLQPEKPGLNSNTLRFCRSLNGAFTDGRTGDDQSNAEGEALFNGFKATTPLRRLFQGYSQDFEWAEAPGVTSLNNTLPPNSYVDFRDANYMALNDPLGYARLLLKHAASFLVTRENTDVRVRFADRRLLLNTRVVSIDYRSATDVSVTVCTTRAVALHTGTSFQCMPNTVRVLIGSHVISTVSVGVLAQSVAEEAASAATRSAPRFIPPLSPTVAAAITAFPMALYSKLFFRFPWKFWQNEQMLLSAFGNGEFAPFWQSLDLPKFLPGSNILFLTVTGERARELQLMPNSPATDTAIINQLLPVLNQIFGAEIATKTGGRATLLRSDVLEFSMARWLQDDLTRGMYSNWRVNRTWAQQEPTRATIGRLRFSGEHTCFRYNGYVHGAFLAGQRTARLLLAERYGRRLDLATLCDQSPQQLVGQAEPLDDEFPHSLGYPRAQVSSEK